MWHRLKFVRLHRPLDLPRAQCQEQADESEPVLASIRNFTHFISRELGGGGAAIEREAGAPYVALSTIDEVHPERTDRRA